MTQWRVMVVALATLMTMLLAARAEDYPTRNVIILVPFAPGGGTDLLARAYAQILEKKYGKTFVIENRPGGGTTLAATAAANATPDGYTLMQGTSGTTAMNPTIFKHLSYEPLKTLVPVSLIAGTPFLLTVNPTLPVHSVVETDGSFHLSVRDTGPGISASDRAKLFQEFQQADNAITRKKGGTGLGLAISKRIIEMHGGKIWVEFQLGQGSTFSLSVPVRVERQAEPV